MSKDPAKPPTENDGANVKGIALGYVMASEFAVTMALGVIAGYWLWKRTPESSPLWLMLGILVGTGLGLYRLIRQSGKDPGKDS